VPTPVVSIKAPDVDRLGELLRQIDAFQPVLKEADKLKSEARAWAESAPPDQPITVEGRLYTLQIGPAALARTVRDPLKLFRRVKRLGDIAAAAIYRVLLTELDKHLPEDELVKHLEVSRSGVRSLKAVAKASPAESVVAA